MDYLKWLLKECNLNNSFYVKYKELLSYLLETDFVYVIEKDRNRALDGLDLRDKYYEDTGYEYDEDCDTCSVLEMLIALSIRVDDEYTGYPGEEHPEDIFLEMFNNLQLNRFKGVGFSYEEVDEILNIWMYRQFQPDGSGSIFMIEDPYVDQREIEIWDQMQEFLNEGGY